MTLDDVIRIVREETGQQVDAETRIESVVRDSLEFTSLMLACDVPDEATPKIHTVNDLYLAATGAL